MSRGSAPVGRAPTASGHGRHDQSRRDDDEAAGVLRAAAEALAEPGAILSHYQKPKVPPDGARRTAAAGYIT
jgi:hypothetical protein